MINIHNKSTYQRFYDRFSAVFIDEYCKARQSDVSSDESLLVAKILLQDYITTELFQNRSKATIIFKAYQDIKTDQELYEKAIAHFHRIN